MLAIERRRGRRRVLEKPTRATVLQVDDVLLLDVRTDAVEAERLAEEHGVRILPLGATHRFGDVLGIGVPFSIIAMIASVILVPILLPFCG